MGKGVWLKAAIPHTTSREKAGTALPVWSQSGIIDTLNVVSFVRL